MSPPEKIIKDKNGKFVKKSKAKWKENVRAAHKRRATANAEAKEREAVALAEAKERETVALAEAKEREAAAQAAQAVEQTLLAIHHDHDYIRIGEYLLSTAKQEDNVLGSIRLSVCPSISQQRATIPITSLRCLSVCLWAYADKCADAVDQLLI